mgnify:CR=1 FL=1
MVYLGNHILIILCSYQLTTTVEQMKLGILPKLHKFEIFLQWVTVIFYTSYATLQSIKSAQLYHCEGIAGFGKYLLTLN